MDGGKVVGRFGVIGVISRYAETHTRNSVAVSAASRSLTVVVTASSIGAAKGGGYARYLESKTVQPERGDYYLMPGGEPAQAPGRWLASADTLAQLGIDGRVVDAPDFIALMEGRHPRHGGWLRQAGADGSRGGGIDVTFSAPKSVSVTRDSVSGVAGTVAVTNEEAVRAWDTVLYVEPPRVRRRAGRDHRGGIRALSAAGGRTLHRRRLRIRRHDPRCGILRAANQPPLPPPCAL